MHYINDLIHEILYIFLNYIVANIPLWVLRKFIYIIMGMKIGKHSRILMKTVIISPWKIQIGNNSIINEHCILDGRGSLYIGSNCTIAMCSKLITATHDIDSDTFEYKELPTKIGDNCACFANSMLLPGVTLDDGVIIAAGSICKKGVYQTNSVYAGNPATFIRHRNITNNYKPSKWGPLFR